METKVPPSADHQLTSRQRRRAEKRKREKESKGGAINVQANVMLPKPPKSIEKVPQATTWTFDVDYNDHFETPKVAYEDIQPIFREIARAKSKTNDDLIIYDPYYCAGGMVELLTELGYHKIINNNRDFYSDIVKKQIPDHDVLITNPPYSGEHKTKLLHYILSTMVREFPLGQAKPFALLLPIYTANKNYWKEFVIQYNQAIAVATSSSASSSSAVGKHPHHIPAAGNHPRNYVFYVVPPDAYEYRHPEVRLNASIMPTHSHNQTTHIIDFTNQCYKITTTIPSFMQFYPKNDLLHSYTFHTIISDSL